jgi:hypothetical protein
MKFFLLALLIFLSLPITVLAASTQLKCPENKVCLENPLGGNYEFTDIAGTIIKGLMGIIGSLTLLMFVWGGFQWLTSAGNAEKVEAGSKTMIWAVIGVLLVFSSYFLISTFTTFLSTGKP